MLIAKNILHVMSIVRCDIQFLATYNFELYTSCFIFFVPVLNEQLLVWLAENRCILYFSEMLSATRYKSISYSIVTRFSDVKILEIPIAVSFTGRCR